MKYSVHPSPLHGQGLFATEKLTAGTLILSERALFSAKLNTATLSTTAPNPVQLLPNLNELYPEDIVALSRLFERVYGEDATRGLTVKDVRQGDEKVLRMLEGVFAQFSYPFIKDVRETKILRLFEDATFLNHYCNPNAEAVWNEAQGRLQVHSTVGILKGDEIFISYLPHPFERRKKRHELLPFACGCLTCCGEGAETTWRNLQKCLARMELFPARFFDAEDERDVDFFADAEVMVGKAREIAEVERKELKVVREDVEFVQGCVERGLCHSSLTVVFEVGYLVHAALFVDGMTTRMQKTGNEDEEGHEGAQESEAIAADENEDQDGKSDDLLTSMRDTLRTLHSPTGRTEADDDDDDQPLMQRAKDYQSPHNTKPNDHATKASSDPLAALSTSFNHLLHNPLPQTQPQNDSGRHDTLPTHFQFALSCKLNQTLILIKCLGIDSPHARRAIAHAWHMVDGDEALEKHVWEELGKAGVRVRRTWGEGGEVVVEVGKGGGKRQETEGEGDAEEGGEGVEGDAGKGGGSGNAVRLNLEGGVVTLTVV